MTTKDVDLTNKEEAQIIEQSLKETENQTERVLKDLSAQRTKYFVDSFSTYIKEVNKHEDSPWKDDGEDPVGKIKQLGVKSITKQQSKLIYHYYSFFKKNKPSYHKLGPLAKKIEMHPSKISGTINRMIKKGILIKIHWFIGDKTSGRRIMVLPNIPTFEETGGKLLKQHLKENPDKVKDFSIRSLFPEVENRKVNKKTPPICSKCGQILKTKNQKKEGKEEGKKCQGTREKRSVADEEKECGEEGNFDIKDCVTTLLLIGKSSESQELLMSLLKKHTSLYYYNNYMLQCYSFRDIKLKLNRRFEKQNENEKQNVKTEVISERQSGACAPMGGQTSPMTFTNNSFSDSKKTLAKTNNSVYYETCSPSGKSFQNKNISVKPKNSVTKRKVVLKLKNKKQETSVTDFIPAIPRFSAKNKVKTKTPCQQNDFFLTLEEKEKLSALIENLQNKKPLDRKLTYQELGFVNFISKNMFGKDFEVRNLFRNYTQTKQFYGKLENALLIKFLEVLRNTSKLAYEETNSILEHYNSKTISGFGRIRNNPKTKTYKHLVIAVTYWLQKFSLEAICNGADFLIKFKDVDNNASKCSSLLQFLIDLNGKGKLNAYFCNDNDFVFKNILYDKADSYEEHHERTKQIYVSCFQTAERGERCHLENRTALRAFLRLLINIKRTENRNLCGHRFAFLGIDGEEPLMQMFFKHISTFNSYGIPFAQHMTYDHWVSFAYQKMQKDFGYVDFWRKIKKIVD